jgi:hypothetical protein
MVGNQGLAAVHVKLFFRFLGGSQARANTTFQTVAWGMSHDPRQHMGGCHDTILEESPSDTISRASFAT